MLWTITIVAWFSDGPHHLWPHTKRECMAASDPDCLRIRTDHCFFRGGGCFLGMFFLLTFCLFLICFWWEITCERIHFKHKNKAWIVESTRFIFLSPWIPSTIFSAIFAGWNFFGNHLPTPTPSNCVIHVPANYSFAFWIRFFESVLDCVISRFHLLS